MALELKERQREQSHSYLEQTWWSYSSIVFSYHYSTNFYQLPESIMSYNKAVILVKDMNRIHSYTPLIQTAVENVKKNATIDIIMLPNISKLNQLDKALAETYSLSTEILEQSLSSDIQVFVLFNDHYKEITSPKWDLLVIEDNDDTVFESFGYPKKESLTLLKSKRSQHEPVNILVDNDESDENIHKVAAVGGTFDHFHDGHKILLTAAAFICSDKLIVGVTDQELLQGKKYQEYLQTYVDRVKNAVDFLNHIKPNLKVDPIAIRDVCGPTGYISDIGGLVVSRETIKGGEFVNNTRREKGFKELQVHVINVIGGEEQDGFKNKLSSTQLRKRQFDILHNACGESEKNG